MKKRLICISVSILLLFSAMTMRIAINYSNVFEEFAETFLKAEIKTNINRIINENFRSRNMQFNEITDIVRSSNGRIISISINSIKLNSILLEIEEKIINELKASSIEMGLPLGNLFGLTMLSGKGPLINVDVIPIISTALQPKSELLSSGINQTLHRVSTVIKTEINCVAPFNKTKCTIETTIILSETLIVGEIPEIIVSPIR